MSTPSTTREGSLTPEASSFLEQLQALPPADQRGITAFCALSAHQVGCWDMSPARKEQAQGALLEWLQSLEADTGEPAPTRAWDLATELPSSTTEEASKALREGAPT